MTGDLVTGEKLDTAIDRHLYALRSVKLSGELWSLCRPWRFFRWRRAVKEVERRNDVLRLAMEAADAARVTAGSE